MCAGLAKSVAVFLPPVRFSPRQSWVLLAEFSLTRWCVITDEPLGDASEPFRDFFSAPRASGSAQKQSSRTWLFCSFRWETAFCTLRVLRALLRSSISPVHTLE